MHNIILIYIYIYNLNTIDNHFYILLTLLKNYKDIIRYKM